MQASAAYKHIHKNDVVSLQVQVTHIQTSILGLKQFIWVQIPFVVHTKRSRHSEIVISHLQGEEKGYWITWYYYMCAG